MKPFDDSVIVPGKKSVRKAGEVLSGKSSVMSRVDAMEILSQWRRLHAYPINTLQSYLRKKVSDLGITNAIVAQRLKRTPSIIAKLVRFENMALDRMQDIGGLRVIVGKIDDVKKLHNAICTSSTFKHQLELPPNDYIDKPKDDGYRSLHQVLRYKNDRHEALNGLRLEIQIRTKLQHSWATAVETVGMIQKSSLKTGGGDESTKKFFKLVSALFAIDEKCNVLNEYKGYSKKDLLDEFENLERKIQIIPQLEGLAVSAHHIETVTKGYDGYHVMQLFIAEKRVRLTAFQEPQDAESFYKVKELETKDDQNIAVVLMSAGNLKEIKKAYPNYFLDTKEFIRNIERIKSH